MPMPGIAMPGIIIGIMGTIGAVAIGIVMVISAGRGIATGRRIGIGIRMVSNMRPNPVRSCTWAVTGAIMGWPYPAMGVIIGTLATCMAGGPGGTLPLGPWGSGSFGKNGRQLE